MDSFLYLGDLLLVLAWAWHLHVWFILFAYSLPNVPVFLFCQIWEFEYSWFLLSFSWYINFIKIHRIPSLAHSELSTCALLIGNLPPTGCSPAQASSSIWTQHFISGNHSCKCNFFFGNWQSLITFLVALNMLREEGLASYGGLGPSLIAIAPLCCCELLCFWPVRFRLLHMNTTIHESST